VPESGKSGDILTFFLKKGKKKKKHHSMGGVSFSRRNGYQRIDRENILGRKHWRGEHSSFWLHHLDVRLEAIS